MAAGILYDETLAKGLRGIDSRVQELTNSHHQLQKSVEVMGNKLGHLQSTMERFIIEFRRNSNDKGVALEYEEVEKSQQESGKNLLEFLEHLQSHEQESRQDLTDAQISVNVTKLDPSSVASEVWYGKENGKHLMKRTGVSTIYNQLYPFEGLLNYTSGIIHHVKMDYKCGDSSLQAMSEEHLFEILQSPGTNNYPGRIAVVGDLGLIRNSTTIITHLMRNDPSMILFVGVSTYAYQYLITGGKGAPCYSCAFPDIPIRESYQFRWDGWGRFRVPLTSRVPVMVIEQNHEIEPQVDALIFKSYLTRFSISLNEFGSNSNFYYSFNARGIHFIMLAAYVEYNTMGDQFSWLKEDLEKFDRSVTTWYSSYSSHYQVSKCMRLEIEALLYQYGVDIVFFGNVHAYEWMSKVYNYTLDPSVPIYITVGDGWNIEEVDVEHTDDHGKYPSVGDNKLEFGGVNHLNFSSDPAKGKFCWNRQPEWSAYRESSFGTGILGVVNSTYALWTWHKNQDVYKEFVKVVVACQKNFNSLTSGALSTTLLRTSTRNRGGSMLKKIGLNGWQEFQWLVKLVAKIMVFDPGGMQFWGCNHPTFAFFQILEDKDILRMVECYEMNLISNQLFS